ncbi:hypothetical protein VTL71DRAFT_11325 [Oculimacula yallundae]|uniref:Uncharacterized protein n=1 Tax=Oculimacula yallundae TaxID=86028 RepID=A0ABR4CQA1_9HELO
MPHLLPQHLIEHFSLYLTIILEYNRQIWTILLPQTIYTIPSYLEALQKCSMWFLFTDGKIYPHEVQSFGNRTTEVGLHEKVNVVIMFGTIHDGAPGGTDFSIGITCNALALHSLFLFHDIQNGSVYLIQVKGCFTALLAANSENPRLDDQTEWYQLPRIRYQDLATIDFPTTQSLHTNKVALHPGLVLRLRDVENQRPSHDVAQQSSRDRIQVSVDLGELTRRQETNVEGFLKRSANQRLPISARSHDIDGLALHLLGELVVALGNGSRVEDLENRREKLRWAHDRNEERFKIVAERHKNEVHRILKNDGLFVRGGRYLTSMHKSSRKLGTDCQSVEVLNTSQAQTDVPIALQTYATFDDTSLAFRPAVPRKRRKLGGMIGELPAGGTGSSNCLAAIEPLPGSTDSRFFLPIGSISSGNDSHNSQQNSKPFSEPVSDAPSTNLVRKHLPSQSFKTEDSVYQGTIEVTPSPLSGSAFKNFPLCPPFTPYAIASDDCTITSVRSCIPDPPHLNQFPKPPRVPKLIKIQHPSGTFKGKCGLCHRTAILGLLMRASPDPFDLAKLSDREACFTDNAMAMISINELFWPEAFCSFCSSYLTAPGADFLPLASLQSDARFPLAHHAANNEMWYTGLKRLSRNSIISDEVEEYLLAVFEHPMNVQWLACLDDFTTFKQALLWFKDHLQAVVKNKPGFVPASRMHIRNDKESWGESGIMQMRGPEWKWRKRMASTCTMILVDGFGGGLFL